MTTRLPAGSGAAFSVDESGHTDAEFEEMADSCSEEIGSPDLEGLPDEELRLSFDLRVAMHDCLVQNGVSTDQPPSWETFRDQWRTGVYWEPIFEVQQGEVDAETYSISLTCDVRDGTVW